MTKVAFLGTPGYVQDISRFDNADLLKAVGANTGNLVFQYAAARVVGGEVEHVGFSGKPYGDPTVFRNLDFFVFPAANHLRADADWSLLSRYLETIKCPMIVLGLGAQAEQGADPLKTAAAIRENDTVMQLVDVFRRKAVLITVRGAFSEAVSHELGLKDVVRMGCPSQFLNPDRTVGGAIRKQIDDATETGEIGAVGVTASAPNELTGWRAELEQKLFGWAAETEGLYIQQSCEDWFFDGPGGKLANLDDFHFSYARRHIAPKMAEGVFGASLARTFRLFFDARQWIDAASRMRLLVGTRIHGNMVAIAASRPGVLVVHDARVSELADEMHIPRVDGELVVKASRPEEILRDIEFDGTEFDAARIRKAGELRDAFDRLGVPVSSHLAELAGAI